MKAADGRGVGSIDRAVMNPATKEVSHIVVRRGVLFVDDKVVPADWISAATEDQVTLKTDEAELEKLPNFVETEYIPVGCRFRRRNCCRWPGSSRWMMSRLYSMSRWTVLSVSIPITIDRSEGVPVLRPTAHVAWRRLTRTGLMALVVTLGLAGWQSAPSETSAASVETDSYPNAQLLVDSAWVAAHSADPMVRIIDMRDPSAYNDGHIPGAVNLTVGAIVGTVNGVPFEFDEKKVQPALDGIGLTPEMTVVIYDDLGMMNSARLFWTLDDVGHRDARILNGGWNAWNAEQRPVSTAVVSVPPSSYPLHLDSSRLVTATQVRERLDDLQTVIVDARSMEEYSGAVKLAAHGGHVPGAVLLTWSDTLSGESVSTTHRDWVAHLQDSDVEVFRPASEIRAELDRLGITPDKHVITYCQTFWRGALVYFLLRLMGFDQVAGYDGSWAEWGNRRDMPFMTGPQPYRAA